MKSFEDIAAAACNTFAKHSAGGSGEWHNLDAASQRGWMAAVSHVLSEAAAMGMHVVVPSEIDEDSIRPSTPGPQS